LYDTLGAEAVAYILNQTQLTTVFVERTEFQILLNAKKSTPSIALANVVLFESANEEEVKLAAAEGVRLRSFADVVSTVRQCWSVVVSQREVLTDVVTAMLFAGQSKPSRAHPTSA
jgi:long-subunit acyl-CoA synthetase (AMP-forming)